MPSPQLRSATLLPGAAPLHHESRMGPGSCPSNEGPPIPGTWLHILKHAVALPELGTRDPEPKVVAQLGYCDSSQGLPPEGQ